MMIFFLQLLSLLLLSKYSSTSVEAFVLVRSDGIILGQNNNHPITRTITTTTTTITTFGWINTIITTTKRSNYRVHQHQQSSSTTNDNNNNDTDNDTDMNNLEYLKTELKAYLQKRKELNADEIAKENIGKVVGGTKGNVVLNYISGSPNKEQVVTTPPNPFDYDELTKYGYGNLITPIMKAGGRIRMYEILNMVPPPIINKPKPKNVPKLIIDRDGSTDKARYSGLKLGQVIDDTIQGQVLENVQQKIKSGVTELRPKLIEESYEIPFVQNNNNKKKKSTSSSTTWKPDWTVEQLDEWGKKQGQAQSWARKAALGEFINDPAETYDFQNRLQYIYSIITISFISIAYGQSTDVFIRDIIHIVSTSEDVQTIVSILQIPASILLLSSIGSSIVCTILASSKNRNQLIWFWKGLLGGPFTLQYLRSLSSLITKGEQQDQQKQQQKQQQ